MLDGANLGELEGILPEQEEEQLDGLDIPADEVDVDAVLDKMQGNLDALEDKVGSRQIPDSVSVFDGSCGAPSRRARMPPAARRCPGGRGPRIGVRARSACGRSVGEVTCWWAATLAIVACGSHPALDMNKLFWIL